MIFNCLESFILLSRLITIRCRSICLRKVIRVFILNIVIFPKTFKCLLVPCLKLILSNLCVSLTWEPKFGFFIGILNTVVYIGSRPLPLNIWVFYWIRTLRCNAILFWNFYIYFILHFNFGYIQYKFVWFNIVLHVLT